MQHIAGLPVAAHAGRVLTGAVVRGLLDRFRLPSYDWLSGLLSEARDRAFVSELWQGVFDEPMPDMNVFDAEVLFANRVNKELFPVDLCAMDSMLGGEDMVLQYPIPVFTFGVPWEMALGVEIDGWAVPMVAAIHAAGMMCEDSPIFCEMRSQNGGASDFDDWIYDWWLQQGYDSEPVLTWPRDQDGAAMELLKRLPPPLDGLAGMYLGVVKGTGSIFYDWPGGYYQSEYSSWDYYCWCPRCVKDLASEFALVRDDVRRMVAYQEWWVDASADDQRRVAAALVGLEEDAGE